MLCTHIEQTNLFLVVLIYILSSVLVILLEGLPIRCDSFMTSAKLGVGGRQENADIPPTQAGWLYTRTVPYISSLSGVLIEVYNNLIWKSSNPMGVHYAMNDIYNNM